MQMFFLKQMKLLIVLFGVMLAEPNEFKGMKLRKLDNFFFKNNFDSW